MKDEIKILSNIEEWRVYQQINDIAEIEIKGEYCLSDKDNYPIIRVVDLEKEQVVIYEKVELENENLWHYNLILKKGCYRIETGIALKIANFDSRYLARGQIINNIFVGEVFLIAGQSNAAGYAKDEVLDLPQYGVSCLKENWNIASHPLGHFNSDCVCSDFLNSGHSAWLKFGKLVLNNFQTPVGIVPAALNGSYIENWQEGQPLFNNLINKAKKTNAKNLIWYQGCSDVFEGYNENYQFKLEKFIEAVKNQLGNIDIYIIQISGSTNIKNPDIGWRKIREIQRETAAKYKTFLIPTYDLINYSDDIHIGSKDNLILAERVFKKFVDKKIYKEFTVCKSQVIKIVLPDNQVLSQNAVDNIFAFDENNKKISCKVSVQNDCIFIDSENINQIKYISLSFGRLFNGKSLSYIDGELFPYFYVEV